MEKVIFIGKSGSGKTTLCQKLHEMEMKYKKTQSVEFYQSAIDTPGEYLENRNYYRGLIMSAIDAKIIAFIGDPTAKENYLPPAFATTFSKEVIGIVTKIAVVVKEEAVRQTEEVLRAAGAGKIFRVDTIEGIGIDELFKYLKKQLDREADL